MEKKTNYEIEVTCADGTITTNFELLKTRFEAEAARYEMITYAGEDVLIQMKNDRADLNKVKKRLDETKKNIRSQYMAPFEDFSKKVDELKGIVDKPASVLDRKIKEMEQELKRQKKDQILAFYEKVCKETGFSENPFSKKLLGFVYDPRWENSTSTQKAYKNAICDAVSSYRKNVEMIQSRNEPELEAEAVRRYEEHLDIQDALRYIQEQREKRAEMERIRLEAEARAKAEAEEEARREVEEAKRAAEEKVRKAKEEAEAKSRHEAEDARKKAEAEIRKAKEEAEAKARREAEEARLKAEAEIKKAKEEAERKAKARVEQARSNTESTINARMAETACQSGAYPFAGNIQGYGTTPNAGNTCRERHVTRADVAGIWILKEDKTKVLQMLRANGIWYREAK